MSEPAGGALFDLAGGTGFCAASMASERLLELPAGKAPSTRIGVDMVSGATVVGPTAGSMSAVLVSIICPTRDAPQLLVDIDGRRVLLDGRAVPMQRLGASQYRDAWVYIMGSRGVVEAEIWRDEMGLATLRTKVVP